MAIAKARDKRWAENISTGRGDWQLRMGIDKPKNGAEWMVQFWIVEDDGQNRRTGGSYILIPPDSIRAGLHNREYEGVGDQGKPCRLVVEGSDTSRTTVTKLFNTDYQRPHQTATVDSGELRRLLAEVFHRLDED